MAQPVIQTNFNSGEWAPSLNARVDLQKYHAGAALIRNFFVDYRGGVSTRAGTKYVLQARDSTYAVRIIGMQISPVVGYILEFGNGYLRFHYNGSPVLETTKAISAATKSNPATITVVGHGYSVGDWIYILAVGGMTQLNGKYYKISVIAGNILTLTNLNGTNINSLAYSTYTASGTTQRVYTVTSPYLGSDLFTVKYAQNITSLVLCNPNYVPYALVYSSPTSWALGAISFGSTAVAPAPILGHTYSAGNVYYAYTVTTVDAFGQESAPSIFATAGPLQDSRTVAGTFQVIWGAVTGALYYNVYKAELSYAGPLPSGTAFGYVGFAAGTTFIDSNIASDFSITPPITNNPFLGSGVQSITVTSPGTYTTTPPTVSIGAPGLGGHQASAIANLSCSLATPNNGGLGYLVGDTITLSFGVVLLVTGTVGSAVSAVSILSAGSATGSLPPQPVAQVSSSSASGNGAVDFFLNWGVIACPLVSPGDGYTGVPTVTFSFGAAAATATLSSGSGIGNPGVPAFFQQRLVLAATLSYPQSFVMSQPGFYYNFNVSNPIQEDDAIEGTIVAEQLNTIKALIPMPSGLLALCDKRGYLINGGSAGAPVTPISLSANGQAYAGCANNPPPIVANYDIIYVQQKGSVVRDLTYNFYTNVYTGTDLSVLSNHLFYGYTIVDWAYAEEPFKIIWAVRSDGIALSLTFLKEQEIYGWAHSDTNGFFKSVATVTEQVAFGYVDATYFVVQRVVNGFTVQYIERMAERIFPTGTQDAWAVDAGLSYNSTPATVFSGLDHLEGMQVIGLADGEVVPLTTVAGGSITLATAASQVTLGLPFTPQLQTLGLDLGEPTVQGKRKKITGVTLRCAETLGLEIGRSFDSLVPMKDLVIGNVGSMTNEEVTGLVTGDARTNVDPLWDVPGQYCIEQPSPLPATILGVIPEIVVGDGAK